MSKTHINTIQEEFDVTDKRMNEIYTEIMKDAVSNKDEHFSSTIKRVKSKYKKNERLAAMFLLGIHFNQFQIEQTK